MVSFRAARCHNSNGNDFTQRGIFSEIYISVPLSSESYVHSGIKKYDDGDRNFDERSTVNVGKGSLVSCASLLLSLHSLPGNVFEGQTLIHIMKKE